MFLFFIFSFSVLRKLCYIFSSSAANSKNHTNMETEEHNNSMQNLDDIDADSILGDIDRERHSTQKEDPVIVEDTNSTLKSDGAKNEKAVILSPKRESKESKQSNEKRVAIAKPNISKHKVNQKVVRVVQSVQRTTEIISKSAAAGRASVTMNDRQRIIETKNRYRKDYRLSDEEIQLLNDNLQSIIKIPDSMSDNKSTYINYLKTSIARKKLDVDPSYYSVMQDFQLSIGQFTRSATGRGSDVVFRIAKETIHGLLNMMFGNAWMISYRGTFVVPKYGKIKDSYGKEKSAIVDQEEIELSETNLRSSQNIQLWSMTATLYVGPMLSFTNTNTQSAIPFGSANVLKRNVIEAMKTYAMRDVFSSYIPSAAKIDKNNPLYDFVRELEKKPEIITTTPQYVEYENYIEWKKGSTTEMMIEHADGTNEPTLDSLMNEESRQRLNTIMPTVEEMSEEEDRGQEHVPLIPEDSNAKTTMEDLD